MQPIKPKYMPIEALIHVLLPQSKAEVIMSVIDSAGIAVCLLMNIGALHNIDIFLESGIKIVTLLSLVLTVALKIKSLVKKDLE